MPTTLIVIHPKEMIRHGLLSVFKDTATINVVGQGSTANEATSLTKRHRPDIILFYDQLNGEDSFEAARILAESNDLRIVMIGVEENPIYFARAAAAGVHDYLFEGSAPREITLTIKNVAAGKVPSPSTGYGKILLSMKDRSLNPAIELSSRELQVLRHIGYGLSNEEIAQSLDIGINTVKEHVHYLLRKMEIKDRTQAAVWAIKEGLV